VLRVSRTRDSGTWCERSAGHLIPSTSAAGPALRRAQDDHAASSAGSVHSPPRAACWIAWILPHASASTAAKRLVHARQVLASDLETS